MNAACANLASVLAALGCLARQPATPAQLASWAAAAVAGLRLQPLLLRLAPSSQQLSLRHEDAAAVFDGAERLSRSLLQHVWERMPSLQEQGDAGAADSDATRRALAFRLWELHTATARLCHFLVSRGSPELAGTRSVGFKVRWAALADRLACMHGCALNSLLMWHCKCAGLPTGTDIW